MEHSSRTHYFEPEDIPELEGDYPDPDTLSEEELAERLKPICAQLARLEKTGETLSITRTFRAKQRAPQYALSDADLAQLEATPKFSVINDGICMLTRPLPGDKTRKEWEGMPAMQAVGDSGACAKTVISELVDDRIDDSYSEGGEGRTYPAMTAAEVLDALGVARVTRAQIEEVTSCLNEKLGAPRLVDGVPRWLIALRLAIDKMDIDLAFAFPRPMDELLFHIHLEGAGGEQ